MELRNHHKAASRLLVMLLALTGSAAAVAANIYRYEDNQGHMVWDSKIPPEFVKNGYTILNERGQVIQVVPKALTQDEIAKQAGALAAQRLEEENAIKQAEADSLLLRLFRSPADIERKRDEKLEQLDVQRTVLTAALVKTDQEITRLTAEVSRSEAAGIDVSEDVPESLKYQGAEKLRLENLLTKLDTEAQQARADAERDIKRLQELIDTADQPRR